MTYVVPLSTVYLVGVIVMPFWGYLTSMSHTNKRNHLLVNWIVHRDCQSQVPVVVASKFSVLRNSKINLSHTRITTFMYSSGVFSKFSKEHSCHCRTQPSGNQTVLNNQLYWRLIMSLLYQMTTVWCIYLTWLVQCVVESRTDQCCNSLLFLSPFPWKQS